MLQLNAQLHLEHLNGGYVTRVSLSTRIAESIHIMIRAASHLQESKLIRVDNQQISF